jgi:hypothetical protein
MLRLLVTANVPSSPILVTLMMEVSLPTKHRFLQEPHDVTSQKTAFFKTDSWQQFTSLIRGQPLFPSTLTLVTMSVQAGMQPASQPGALRVVSAGTAHSPRTAD